MKTHWRVHVGAHKTATTHLQDLLKENDQTLLEHGVDVLESHATSMLIRSEKISDPTPLNRLKSLVKSVSSAGTGTYFAETLRKLRRDKPITILTHEDQLGFSQDLLRPRLYDGSERFSALRSLPDKEGLEIFLSIRSFDTLFISAFCEILKPFHDARARLEARRSSLRDAPPSWFDLAERLADAFPGTPVHVWTFEDYVQKPDFVVKALTGLNLEDLSNRPAPDRTRAPSPKAVELAENLDPGLEVPKRMEAVRNLFAKHPRQAGEKLEIFTPDETDWLRACYTRDLERIEASDRMVLLRT